MRGWHSRIFIYSAGDAAQAQERGACLAERARQKALHLILRRVQLEIIASRARARTRPVSILKFPSDEGLDLKMAKYCALAGDKF
jgi:hypothetical protein